MEPTDGNMNGESIFVHGERPHVKAMYGLDAIHLCQIGYDRVIIDALGEAFHEHIQSILHDGNRREQHHRRKDERANWICQLIFGL